MGKDFDLVEPTVQSIKPICNGSAAMAMRLRWYENSPTGSLVMLKLQVDLFGRLQSHGATGQGEVIEIVQMKALTSKYYVRRETKTERKRARDKERMK